MKKLEKQFTQATEHIVLKDSEKALMREQLISYMQLKPIRARTKTRARSISFPSFTFFRAHHYSGALAVALLATVSTFGVSSAADSALPGDLLYPVKVNVNEEIKTVFLGSDAEELLWESERAELRLQEASQLASEGRLDTKKQEAVAKLFAEHTDAVTEKVRAIEEHDPALAVEVSSDLEAALGAHEVVLARLIVEQGNGAVGEDGARGLVEQVRTAALEVEKTREGAEQILGTNESETSTSDDLTDVASESQEVHESVVDDNAPKTESANMRERAVYRAQERVTESLTHARQLVSDLDQQTDIAKQATSQLAAGEALMAQGTALLAEHELGAAYGYYRRADMIFQKVSRLLEAMDLFSLEVLHDTVADELPTVVESVVEGTEATGTPFNKDEQETPNNETIRANTQNVLAETRSLLLTVDGFDEKVVNQANSLIKDAMAHVMRADIAVALNDTEGAVEIFARAHTQAERALDIVSRAARDLGMVNTVKPDNTAPIGEDGLPDVTLTHRYESNTHVWTGTIEISTPCASLETGALVAESHPEQITLTLNITQPTQAICTQSIDVRSFEIRAAASPEATVRSVQINGIEREWIVVEE